MSRFRPAVVVSVLGALVLLAHVMTIAVPYRFREALDVLHIVGFAALTIYLLPLARALGRQLDWSTAAAALTCLASITLFAFVAEAAQILTARDASAEDLVRDFGGIAAGTFVVGIFWTRGLRRFLLAVLAFACLTVTLWIPGRVLVATVLAETRVPELMLFESPLDELLYSSSNARVVRVRAEPDWPVPGMLADVTAERGYAGIAFRRLPQDWTAYRYLSFIIAGHDEGPSDVTIRIHDRNHNNEYDDRFNRRFEIGTEPERIRVPLADVQAAPRGRSLDLSRIEEVTVFVSADESSGFMLDELRLE